LAAHNTICASQPSCGLITGDEMKLRLLILFTTLLSYAICAAEPLPLERAVQLALAHSTTTAVASADSQRAYAAHRDDSRAYIPQATVGSGLGYTYGFPLTLEGAAAAVVNLVAQSTVYNPSQRQFENAAKTEWQASKLQDKDQRNAVIQDVAVSYAELG